MADNRPAAPVASGSSGFHRSATGRHHRPVAQDDGSTAEWCGRDEAPRDLGLQGRIAAEHAGQLEGVELHEQAAERVDVGAGSRARTQTGASRGGVDGH
jgi:hypothetical protein